MVCYNTATEGCDGLPHSHFRRTPLSVAAVLVLSLAAAAGECQSTLAKHGESVKPPAQKSLTSKDPSAAKRTPSPTDWVRRAANRQTLLAVLRAQARNAALAGEHKTGAAGTSLLGEQVVRTALSYRGVPYRFGGTSRGGLDCSGFTSAVYRRQGVRLQRTASGQFTQGQHVPQDQLKPGDLVFFHTTRRGISHVGIYTGNGKFVHAATRRGRVSVDTLDEDYYRRRYRGARRVKKG